MIIQNLSVAGYTVGRRVSANVLALQEVGVPIAIGIEALNCLPVRNEVKAGLPPLPIAIGSDRSTIPIAIGFI